MALDYQRFAPDDAEVLADFLTAEPWRFHAGARDERSAVLRRIAGGYYDNETTQTFWVSENDTRIGMIRLEDLADDTPMFDLRFRAAHRGHGHGTAAVAWLTTHLFTTLPDVNRVEAVTRQDNRAMRRVLVRNGYAKESHYRNAWPSVDGQIHDAVGYAIIRTDWESGMVTPPDWNDEP